jgi:hypothetical protein
MENTPTFRALLFVFGLVGWVAVELAQWLAGMPDGTAVALRTIALVCIAGPRTVRAVARAVGARSSSSASSSSRERGSIALELLVWVSARLAVVALAGLAVYALTACGPRHVRAEQSVDVYHDPGPPCLIVVKADGRIVGRVDWAKPCPLQELTP